MVYLSFRTETVLCESDFLLHDLSRSSMTLEVLLVWSVLRSGSNSPVSRLSLSSTTFLSVKKLEKLDGLRSRDTSE